MAAQNFVGVPEVYPELVKLRQSKTASFKSNKYLKESTKLRYYQVVGALHMMMLNRMVLGDGTGLGKCLESNSYVNTNHGLVKIKDLLENLLLAEDTFYNTSRDFQLLTKDGLKHADKIYYCGKKEGLRITTEHGYTLHGLPHHPILCPDSYKQFQYKKLEETHVGDFVCINKKGHFSEEYPLLKDKKVLTEDVAERLGYHLSRSKTPDGALVQSTAEFELLDIKDPTGIPSVILRSPRTVVVSFLRSFIEGLSTLTDRVIIQCKTDDLGNQLQLLLLNFGIVSKRVVNNLTISGQNIELFKNEIGFATEKRNIDLAAICKVSESGTSSRKDFLFDPIVSITPEPGDFCDFQVPGDHNFTGNGFINHNTIQTIASYSFLLEQDPTLKVLVVCPKSALYQWAEEVDKFTTGITTRVIQTKFEKLEGFQARKYQYDRFKEHMMIMNYAPLLDEYEYIKNALGDNYMIVFDEAVAFKNRKSKTHFACAYLAMNAKRVYGLSATIIKNGLEEVYGIYAVVVPGLFGNITKFKDTFCQQKLMRLVIGGKPRMIPKVIGYKNLDQFKRVLDPYFLLRRKEEVATELPKLISRKVILEMEPEQKTLYKEALNGILYEEKIKREYYEVTDAMRNGDISEKTTRRFNELKEKYDKFMTTEGQKRGKLAALTYCQMVSNGPSLLNMPGESSKDVEFERLLTDELLTEKIIVFTRFKTGIPALEVICERKHIGYAKITGDVLTARERDQARLRFTTDPACRVMFITTAGSASLNLQIAGVIIFIDTPWSYGDLVQTIGRAQRIGSLQEHILLIHFVNKGTIDVRVMTKVTDKKDLSDSILGDISEGALDFASNEENVVDDLFNELLKDAEDLNG